MTGLRLSVQQQHICFLAWVARQYVADNLKHCQVTVKHCHKGFFKLDRRDASGKADHVRMSLQRRWTTSSCSAVAVHGKSGLLVLPTAVIK